MRSSDLFDRLGFELTDYHNSTSECSIDNGRSKTVGEDGTDDELKGLINFVRGQDYFDYNGNCNITEFRDHILGDIYHSQLIEIGPPDGNTDFTNNNEEAYYRSLKNYQFFKTNMLTEKILYMQVQIVGFYTQLMQRQVLRSGLLFHLLLLENFQL